MQTTNQRWSMMSHFLRQSWVTLKRLPALLAMAGIGLCLFPNVLDAVEASGNMSYVADSVDISMRSGPEVNYRIIRMLKSGMKLRVLEKNGNGWSRVRDENDKDGWILDRYLTDKVPASLRVAELEQTMESLRVERDALEKKFNEVRQSNQILNQDRAELERLRSLMQNTLKVDNENKQLKIKFEQMNNELMHALDEKRLLERQSDTSFFVSGATVLGLGMLAGFILAKKRRNPYSSL
ncbi:MAG: TIGR04211 family SH3 domain-containing protein [Magnetococcales bacterium]|nr:TIGR04211 family SH3 domain-containing protein [Magnetococcales bacterium]MBF0151883.1 TIGR04211 family SH3 domain-containing protein [Magnetococcales bacterium]MBF0174893.1 TIGR04211 family SH3 domain-containing protein [Magnetococcales bacterium]MBF0349069.1 TIGR04211 family SH3 domain-containing protein [Magnetococcales bacterium]MBF0632495.1 TIGR04211 family SH3 domain-containing protein [Magnetococcales bacterium]